MKAGRYLVTFRRHWAYPYVLAVVLALTGLALRVPFGRTLAPFPFVTFYPAVLLAVGLSGKRAGITCAVMSACLAWLFILAPDARTLQAIFPTGGVGFTGFAAACAIGIWIVGRLRAREGKLKETAAGLDALIENAPIGFAFVDRDGHYVRVNEVMAAVNGLSMAEHIGRSCDEAAPDVAAVLKPAVAQVFSTGNAISGLELEGRSAVHAGETRTWLATVFPVRGADGCVVHAGVTVNDITDRKRGETAVRQSNAALEGAVRDAQAALTQAQKMEAVGQLTGGIAHDFNNLLGAMLGNFDLIRRKADNPQMVLRFADMGLQAAERGTRLTAQLLAFSRVQRMELRPVAVGEILTGMRELLERTLGPMIRLTLDVRAEGLRVMSDPTQLEMAVLNLAINARDAMPEGGDLTLSATSVSLVEPDAELPAGTYAEIVVVDTGEGMDESVASRAFDPFFTTKEVGKGTGLGLSQVYGIARQGGGTARIESAAGKGTRVRILLPLIAREDAQAGMTGGGTAANRQRRPARVLVIDDDTLMRETLSEALQALGHAVTAASGGTEGLELLAREAHDVIILDFAMPGMNGADVAAHAAKIRPGIPIVFSTGYSNTTAIEAAAGSDAIVLRKPFMIETLDQTIGAVIGAASQE